MTRVVFMGTPDFAVPTLQALLADDRFDVIGVVTQPDRPAGRGGALREPPVKQVAEAAGVPVFQPATLRQPEAVAHLQAWQPDLIVVTAFGQILRQNVLDLPVHGCINVHASLLPRWRGAAPIQAAIRAGDESSGVTIMVMDAGLDTGPMLSQRAILLDPRETAATVHDRLATLGGALLLDTLPAYLDGSLTPQPQPDDEALITHAPQIKKEEGELDWTQDAIAIDRLVRAFTPWPGTYTQWSGQRLKIITGHPANGHAEPGQVLAHRDGLAIGTGGGLYVPDDLQLAGRKTVTAAEFVRGQAGIIGTVLG